MPNLFTIPTELLDEISSSLDPVTISHLLLTCRGLSSRFAPAMHQHAIAPKDNMPALHWSAHHGHLPLAKYLLTVFPVDLLNTVGETALHVATFACHAPIAELLLQHGAAVDRTTCMKFTPIANVCRSSHRHTAAAEATMRVLLAHGANVHGVPPNIPLRDAILCGASRAAQQLLAAGASAVAQTEDGESLVLSTARGGGSESGGVRILGMLLAHGADVNAANGHGTTPLMVAAGRGCLSTVRILVERGADVNLVDRAGRTAFSFACMCRNEQVVAYLARCDALDVHDADLGDQSPVYLTTSRGCGAALEILLQRGAATDYIDTQGRSVVQVAVLKGRSEMVRVLLATGVTVETSDHEGRTPLVDAVSRRDRVITGMLLAHQPDRRRDGFGPLIAAAIRGSRMMVEMLLEGGTDINRVNEAGVTVLDEARRNGLQGVVEVLESFGAVSGLDA